MDKTDQELNPYKLTGHWLATFMGKPVKQVVTWWLRKMKNPVNSNQPAQKYYRTFAP